MKEEKLYYLVKQIHEQTVKGQLKWEKTTSSGRYQAVLQNFIIHIQEEVEPSDGELFFTISLSTKNGVQLERISPGSLQRAAVAAGKSGYGMMLDDTYKYARRQALGVEEAIDKALSELDNLK
jgi:hypothetical protein